MANLFVIDGAFGNGKSRMLNFIETHYVRNQAARVIRKFSAREDGRPIDRSISVDLDVLDVRTFQRRCKSQPSYYYKYEGQHYGFAKRDLQEALSTVPNVFVVVRDREMIRELKREWGPCVIPVYIYTDACNVKEALERRGASADDMAFHFKRLEGAWLDFLAEPHLYSEMIVNNSSEQQFHSLVDGLIRRYSDLPYNVICLPTGERVTLPLPLVGHRDAIQRRLDDNYHRNVFLMMKFRDGNKSASDFILDQIKLRGWNGIRADQRDWNITDDVYNPIAVLLCCKAGIALFDEPEAGSTYSPNVAYELGMMHLQRKDCLILRHETLPAMPFDLVARLRRDYNSTLDINAILSEWLMQIGSK